MRSSVHALLLTSAAALTCRRTTITTTAFPFASSPPSHSSPHLFADRQNPYRDIDVVPISRQRIPYDDINDETSPRYSAWESSPDRISDEFVSESWQQQQQQQQQLNGQDDTKNRPLANNQSRRRRRNELDENQREYDYYDDEDSYAGDYDDDRENDDFTEESGNFWANPVANVDTNDDDDRNSPSHRSRRRPVGGTGSTTTQRSKTSLRSVEPEPPAPLVEMYNRLFWFGLGDDNDRNTYTSNGSASRSPDKTMFGGTKGKFNGLAFFNAGLDTVPSDKRPRYRTSSRSLPSPRDNTAIYDRDRDTYNNNSLNEEDYNNHYDDNNVGNDNYVNRVSAPESSSRNDYRSTDRRRENPTAPNRRQSIDTGSASREERQRSTTGSRGSRNDRGDWVSNTVSSWFSPNMNQKDDDDDDDDDDWDGGGFDESRADSNRRGQRGRHVKNTNGQRGDTKWSPLALLDTFLGLDRNQLEGQAALYDTQMGLRSTAATFTTADRNVNGRRSGTIEGMSGAPRQRRGSGDSSRTRGTETPPPRTWQPPVDSSVDLRFEPQQESVDVSYNLPTGKDNDANQEVTDRVMDTEPTPVPNRRTSRSSDTVGSSLNDAVSWSERALAVERVPPSTILAWGPTGDLGMDARTKAVTDAVEDVQTAQAIVDEWDRHIAGDKDDIAIRRIDVELERRQTPWKGESPAVYNERMRRLDRQVDDMARRLRYNILQRDLALDELDEIKVRHWALLSFYDPNQAEEGVKDMLRELEESEPAVRRYKKRTEDQTLEVPGNM